MLKLTVDRAHLWVTSGHLKSPRYVAGESRLADSPFGLKRLTTTVGFCFGEFAARTVLI